MGNHIRAIIGKKEAIIPLAKRWKEAETITLPQDFAMAFLTDALWERISGAFPGPEEPNCPFLTGWDGAVSRFLREGSRLSPLGYIETDYFGGHGTQAGVLADSGAVVFGPEEGEGTIDHILERLGVAPSPGTDEFDTLGLGRYRRMD